MNDEGLVELDRAPTASENAGRRVLLALCVASFLSALNFFATTPFYPKIARDLDTTVPLLGQVVTLMIVISAVLGLAVGPLADRYGSRRLLVAGMLAIALNLLGTGLARAYPVLLGLSLFGGLGDALVFGLTLAVAGSRFTGDARRKALGWTIGALSSAPILGIPILTAIADAAGWRAALLASGAASAAAAWFVAVSLPPDDRRPQARIRLRELASAYTPLLEHAPTLRLYAVTGLRAACWLGLLTYLGAFLEESVGLSTHEIGLVYTLSGIGYAVGSVVAGRWLGHREPRTAVAIASLVTGLALAAVLMSADARAVVAMLLVGSFAAATVSVGVADMLVVESPAGTSTTMVLNGSVLNAGSAVGTALGGVLIAIGGFEALGIGLPGFALAGAVLAWWPAGTAKHSATPT